MKSKMTRNEEAYTLTVEEAFEEFMAEKIAMNLSEPTQRNYRFAADKFMDMLGCRELEVSKLEKSDIFRWINTMKNEDVKPISINGYIMRIKAFLKWCMDEEREYLKPFKIQTLKVQEEVVKLFSDEDLEKLLEKPRRNDSFATWRSYTIVNWVLATGNRAATICDVQIGDINFGKKEITLRHTKNKKSQVIPLSSSLSSVLKEYIKMWRSDATLDDYLFPNIGNEKMTTRCLSEGFVRYCNARGTTRQNIHGLRHNFAKAWVQNNGNMFVLQKVLGHSSLEMTRRYVKLFSEDIKEDYDKYAALDSMKRSSNRTKKVSKMEF